jgi:hypothetical protein
MANCASVDSDIDEQPMQISAFDNAVTEVGPAQALVRLPGAAGRIARVRERRFVNGAAQEITLAEGDIDNRLEIAVGSEPEDIATTLAVPMAKPTEDGIRLELAERFPNVSMQIVTRAMSNSYGPFGLAIGASGRDGRCIYGWQWIEDVRGVRASKASFFRKLNAMASGKTADAWVRLRLCRHGLTVDQLATAMTQLVVGGPAVERLLGSFTVTGRPVPRTLESQIAPLDNSLSSFERGLRSPPAPRRSAPRPQAKKKAEETDDTSRWHSVDEDGKRYLAPPNSAGGRGSEGAPRVVPRPGAVSGGEQPENGSVGAAPPPRMGLPPSSPDGSRTRALDPNVPSRAYTGPSNSREDRPQ